MDVETLKKDLFKFQNKLIDNYQQLETVWKYHPSNPYFLNPIREYDSIKNQIMDLEVKIVDLELKIKTLKSMN
jgi:hypothetical protein